jgi:hypothetical protein
MSEGVGWRSGSANFSPGQKLGIDGGKCGAGSRKRECQGFGRAGRS